MQLFSAVPPPGKHANSIEPSGVADNRTVRGDAVGNNGRLFVGRGVSLGDNRRELEAVPEPFVETGGAARLAQLIR